MDGFSRALGCDVTDPGVHARLSGSPGCPPWIRNAHTSVFVVITCRSRAPSASHRRLKSRSAWAWMSVSLPVVGTGACAADPRNVRSVSLGTAYVPCPFPPPPQGPPGARRRKWVSVIAVGTPGPCSVSVLRTGQQGVARAPPPCECEGRRGAPSRLLAARACREVSLFLLPQTRPPWRSGLPYLLRGDGVSP